MNVHKHLVLLLTDLPGLITFDYLSDPEHYLTIIRDQSDRYKEVWLNIVWYLEELSFDILSFVHDYKFIIKNLSPPDISYYELTFALKDQRLFNCIFDKQVVFCSGDEERKIQLYDVPLYIEREPNLTI